MMRKTWTIGTSVLLVVGVAAGCAGAKNEGLNVPKTGAAGSASCKVRSVAKPLGQPRAGSSVALAKIGGRSIAFVADEDAHAIEAIDLETQKEIASTPLAGAPTQIMVTTDGRILALLRDASRLQVLEAETATGALVTRCSVETAPEPVSMATTPDDTTILVSSGWGRALTAYDSQQLARQYDVALPREPRSVVVSDDGATAFVSHAVGSVISSVELKKPGHPAHAIKLKGVEPGVLAAARARKKQIEKLRSSGKIPKAALAQLEEEPSDERGRMGCQGFALAKSIAPAGRILAPQVFVDPGDPEARPDGYGDGGQPTEAPGVAVIDEGTSEALEASLLLTQDRSMMGEREARDHREECLLPRAAAVDPRSHTLLVSCFGIDSVIAYDAASAMPQASERRRWTVGAGPSGIAVDPDQPRAVVWAQFDRTLSVLALGGDGLTDEKAAPLPRVTKIALAPLANKVPADFALGRLIFHSGGDTRISKDGRACASCHPDGRDDAITWATPDGPRRSIMLAGRVAGTPPYSWNGTEKTLHEHLANTFDRLDGAGLRSLELDGLVAYISTMRPPVAQQDPHAGDGKVARGAQIFASKEAACSSCHTNGGLGDGVSHDVKSKTKSDRSASFNTPSLHFVGGTGPYFHDGRYKSLHDLLRDIDGKMGHTKQLSENDLESLEVYLRTL